MASLPRIHLTFLSNLNLRSEPLNIVKEQAVILEKIFYYNDVFSLDNGRIPNLVFFNREKASLEKTWAIPLEKTMPKCLTASEFGKVLNENMEEYVGNLGDMPFKMTILLLGQVIVCLPFLFNYFKP